MKTSFAFELKRLFRSTKTWIVMALLILFGLVMIQDYKYKAKEIDSMLALYGSEAKQQIDGELYAVERLRDLAHENFFRFPEIRKDEQFNKIRDSLLKLYGYVSQIDEAYQNKDWKQFNRLYSYIWYHYGLSEYPAELRTTSYTVSDPIIQSHVDYVRYVRDELKYPVFEVFPNDQERTAQFAEVIYLLQYHIALSDLSHQPLNEYSINSSTFIYRYFDNYASILFSVIVVALLYDIVGLDRNSGTIKSLISLPIPRKRFTQTKILSGLVGSLLVILSPLLALSAFMAIFDKLRTLRYPVLAYRDGLMSFIPLENNIKHDLITLGYNRYLGISKFSNYPKDIFTMNPALDFMELWQFMLLSLLLTILFLLFIVLVNQLISTLIKQKMLALGIMLAFIILGSTLAFDQNIWGALNPFNYSNPIAILGGYGTYSYLSGIVVLSAYSLILYVVNIQVINRIDF